MNILVHNTVNYRAKYGGKELEHKYKFLVGIFLIQKESLIIKIRVKQQPSGIVLREQEEFLAMCIGANFWLLYNSLRAEWNECGDVNSLFTDIFAHLKMRK